MILFHLDYFWWNKIQAKTNAALERANFKKEIEWEYNKRNNLDFFIQDKSVLIYFKKKISYAYSRN